MALLVSTAQAQARPPALYFQFAGEGLGLSANLDVGLTQSVRLRGGAGWLWTVGTVPVSLSYLVSRKNATLEVGGGATVMKFLSSGPASGNAIDDFIEKTLFFRGQKTMVAAVGILGWRYHPAEGALLRLTLTPLLLQGRARLYGGASFGFTF
jgi:hypothetical protein